MLLTKNQLKLKLKFKLLRTDEDITPRIGLALFSELFKRIRLKELIKRYMPPSESNRRPVKIFVSEIWN